MVEAAPWQGLAREAFQTAGHSVEERWAAPELAACRRVDHFSVIMVAPARVAG